MATATPTPPHLGLLSMIFEMSVEGMTALPDIREITEQLDPRHFAEMDFVFREIQELVALKQLPTKAALQARNPKINVVTFKQIQQGKNMFGDLESAMEATLTGYRKNHLMHTLKLAAEQIKQGQTDQAWELLQNGYLDAQMDVLSHDYGIEDIDLNLPPPPRPFKVWDRRLNEDLGGGLGITDAMCMSLVIAGSSVGKTTVTHFNVCDWVFEQGHQVIYFAGEASREETLDDLIRTRARFNVQLWKNLPPKFHSRREKARQEFKNLPAGQLQIVDLQTLNGEITGEDVRRISAKAARKLKKDKEAGRVSADCHLIIVIDNWDTILGNAELPRGVNPSQFHHDEARRLAQTAAANHFHAHVLVQASKAGSPMERKGPPLMTDVEWATTLAKKFGFCWALYRPTTPDLENALDRDSNPAPCARMQAAVWKARKGNATGKPVFFELEPETGWWVEPGTSNIPF